MRVTPTPTSRPVVEPRPASTGRTSGTLAAAPASGGDSSIERYDFHSISPKDLLATMNRLIVSGQLDLDETSPLIGLIPSPLAVVAPNAVSPAASSSAFTDPIDVFARLQRGIDFARYNNDAKSERFWQSAVDALQRFQGRPISVDVSA